jgi:geranylgeranyl diphosphate synthase type II
MPEITSRYLKYVSGDKFMPRPLLTYFGFSYKDNLNDFSRLNKIIPIIYLSQLVRDLLAIHDDVVDEDKFKFGNKTLPFLFSELQNTEDKNDINKFGNDLSIYFGDSLIGICFKLINDSNIEDSIRLKLVSLTSNLFILTQKGQLGELILQTAPINTINIAQVIDIHKYKAAYYCYAFPFEIGLTIGSCDIIRIEKARLAMLKIGVASQILDDVIGIFPEEFGNQKNTISDILLLRRTVPLVMIG